MIPDSPYAFAFRGLLTEEALDKAGRRALALDQIEALAEIQAAIPLADLEPQKVMAAQRMAVVYTGIAALENSMRKFVGDVLLETVGADWWTSGVSKAIQERSEGRIKKEEKLRYHGARGGAPIDYADFGDLAKIIQQNWSHFEDYMPSSEWAAQISNVIENSRNIIMHSGTLDQIDIERVGMNIRDWVKQVGA